MPAINDLLKKAKTIPSAIGNYYKKFAENTGKINFPEKVLGIINKVSQFLNKIFPDKKKRLIFAGITAAVLLLIISVMAVMIGTSGRQQNTGSEFLSSQRTIIPPEDLFLPDEPDFVPGIMLERERRTEWTTQDATPFWQDPLKDGEEQWRKQIELSIDELMESVP